jgi:uncharacterized protein (DUF2062 family)
MMTANQRALKKTIIAVLLIAIFIIASNIWPPLAGYAVTAVIVSAIVGLIFMAFAMYEETKEWRKRD